MMRRRYPRHLAPDIQSELELLSRLGVLLGDYLASGMAWQTMQPTVYLMADAATRLRQLDQDELVNARSRARPSESQTPAQRRLAALLEDPPESRPRRSNISPPTEGARQ